FSSIRYAHTRDLHSFPTRRSSDLIGEFLEMQYEAQQNFLRNDHPGLDDQIVLSEGEPVGHLGFEQRADEFRLVDISLLPASRNRSEEHTSELQSRRDLVCRLLLEK